MLVDCVAIQILPGKHRVCKTYSKTITMMWIYTTSSSHYLSYEGGICEWRSNFSAQVEILIVNDICNKQGLIHQMDSKQKDPCVCGLYGSHIIAVITLAHRADIAPPYWGSSEHAIWSEDWRGFGERCEGRGRCRGTLRQAHRGRAFGQRCLREGRIRCQIYLKKQSC